MIKFIERLFIKRRVKQYTLMNKYGEHMNRYIVVGLWSGKFYHSVGACEMLKYTEIWDKEHVRYVSRGKLIMIK